MAIVVLWLVSLPLWPDPKSWQVAIHTVTSVITLLLLALLENAGRRSEEAAQEKLNVIAEALAALMESRGRGPQAAYSAVFSARSNALKPNEPSSRVVTRPSRSNTNSHGSVGRLKRRSGSRKPLSAWLST